MSFFYYFKNVYKYNKIKLTTMAWTFNYWFWSFQFYILLINVSAWNSLHKQWSGGDCGWPSTVLDLVHSVKDGGVRHIVGRKYELKWTSLVMKCSHLYCCYFHIKSCYVIFYYIDPSGMFCMCSSSRLVIMASVLDAWKLIEM